MVDDYSDLPSPLDDGALCYLATMAIGKLSEDWIDGDEALATVRQFLFALGIADADQYVERALSSALALQWIACKPSIPNNLLGPEYRVTARGFINTQASPPWRIKKTREVPTLELDRLPADGGDPDSVHDETRCLPPRKMGTLRDHEDLWAGAVELSKNGCWWQNKQLREYVEKNSRKDSHERKLSRWLASMSKDWNENGPPPLKRRVPEGKNRLTEYTVNPNW